YLGEHLYLKTPAAIKVLHIQLTEETLEQFLHEARTVAHLNHPNIIRVLEFGIEPVPFLVMSYAPQGSLRQRHPGGSQLPLPLIISYVNQLAAALGYAHEHQIIHRDVKPANMLLGDERTVLLGDFGIAMMERDTEATQAINMRQEAAAVGTVLYMAPEQLKNTPEPASDQYALGAVVYEWLCGTPPFRGSPYEVAYGHLHLPLPLPREHRPDLNPQIEQVVLRALAREARDRFPRIQDFARALEAACHQPSSSHVAGTERVSGPLLLQPSPLAPMPDFPPPPIAQGSRPLFMHMPQQISPSTSASEPTSQALPVPEPVNLGSRPKRSLSSLSRRRVIAGLAGGGLTILGGVLLYRAVQPSSPLPPAHAQPTKTATATSPTATPTPVATVPPALSQAQTRPAISSWGETNLELIARGSDNALWRRHYDGSWHDWEALGGTLSYDPVVASWGAGRLDIFARGADNTLMHKAYDGSWQSWESLGGTLTADPAVATWGVGQLTVIVRGIDNGYWRKFYDGTWHDWEPLGGSFITEPTIASWGANHIDIFGIGTDNALWHRGFEGAWQNWESLGGSLTSAASASSWAAGRLDVFARGADNTLMHIWYNGSWGSWETLGGALTTSPSATAWGGTHIEVFARDAASALQHTWFDGNWHSWEAFH
ncbi:MAG: protein kinase, partial [Ktedonobacteraceae bacterium]|nr:protein kinase [Ktedonobacteraceae bacterium]